MRRAGQTSGWGRKLVLLQSCTTTGASEDHSSRKDIRAFHKGWDSPGQPIWLLTVTCFILMASLYHQPWLFPSCTCHDMCNLTPTPVLGLRKKGNKHYSGKILTHARTHLRPCLNLTSISISSFLRSPHSLEGMLCAVVKTSFCFRTLSHLWILALTVTRT